MQIPEEEVKMSEASSINIAIKQEWRNALKPWGKALLAVGPGYLLTRLILIMLTYLGGVLFSVPNASSFALTFNSVLYSWYHWDTPRYLTIASQGYLDQSTTGFFPLYPALVHLCSTIFHQDVLLTAMVISNLALLGALVMLYRLVENEFDREIAQRSVLYLTIFPTALLLFTAYDLALSLFFILSCFYLLRQGAWWLAGVFGGLAALTQAAGSLLLIIFIYEFIQQHGQDLRQGRWKKRIEGLELLSRLAAGLLILVGSGLYAYTLAKKFEDPLIFLHPQVGSKVNAPWTAPFQALENVFHGSAYTFAATHSGIELCLLGLLVVALILSCVGPLRLEKGQSSFTVFGFLLLMYSLIFPSLPSGIQSPLDPMPALQHSILATFIVFILLARLGRQSWLHQSYLLVGIALQILFVCQLFTNHWAL